MSRRMRPVWKRFPSSIVRSLLGFVWALPPSLFAVGAALLLTTTSLTLPAGYHAPPS